MKSLKNKVLLAAASLVAAVPAMAAGPDMSSIVGAIDATTIVVAIGAVAAIKVLPLVAAWGYGAIMSFMGKR